MSVVSELMQKDPVGIEPDASASYAARLMAATHLSSLVVSRENHYLGILTEEDLVVRVIAAGRDPENTSVEQVMTRNGSTVTPRTSIDNCLELFLLKGFRHLPVLNDGGVCVGMLSSTDFLPHLKGKLGKILDDEAYRLFLEEMAYLEQK